MCRTALLNELGIEALYLGVGVDRVDYTKGIVERLLGVERFLEKYPQFRWQAPALADLDTGGWTTFAAGDKR